MRNIILYYLYGILLIPILLRLIFGDLANKSFHPGLIIHGIVFILLAYFFFQHKTEKRNLFVKLFYGFIIVWLLNLVFVEFALYNNPQVVKSFTYVIKVIIFPLLAYYILKNYNFFSSKFDSIMLVNSIVLIMNVLIGYFFKIGWKSYTVVEDSYRGLLAGNDTSIFSFVVFGYGLFKFDQNKRVGGLILILSLICMYIIATKAIVVAIIIFILKVFNKGLLHQKNIRNLIFISIIIGVIVINFGGLNKFSERIILNYEKQVAKGEKSMSSMDYEIPENLMFMNELAPNRFVYGIEMIILQINRSVSELFFGFGYTNIYRVFGRPPMSEIFLIIGYFGIFGFAFFYIPQLVYIINLLISKKFNLINILLISIFLYGSLGGFLYGVSSTTTLFSLLFGLSYSEIRKTGYKIYF